MQDILLFLLKGKSGFSTVFQGKTISAWKKFMKYFTNEISYCIIEDNDKKMLFERHKKEKSVFV